MRLEEKGLAKERILSERYFQVVLLIQEKFTGRITFYLLINKNDFVKYRSH